MELDWFIAYLEKSKQFCKVNCKIPEAQDIGCGVPQGSCLGPMLLLVYVKDWPVALQNQSKCMRMSQTVPNPRNVLPI